ncbi:MAG: type IV pilus twitching motility protein PilT [Candidatus Omnitrophica bacterium]|nr:type IV pilus twitching motility protein PilT [Candidatus Omnitrophota bacterium]
MTARSIDKYIKAMVQKDASDIHITAGSPVHIRVDEILLPVDDDVLSAEGAKDLVYSLLNDEQKERFEKDLELDISFGVKDMGRFRVNVFKQRGTIASSIRLIPHDVWSFEKCGLPAATVLDFCKRPKGLVLVTGATGSGKSTSLAAMIDWINTNKECHIVTVEDPIEFVYTNKKAVINQREVHQDTHSFPAALKHVLRQDPDVILIGEMRDLETIESALTIAETGHLVFATLHTSDCVQTVNRIIDVFPAHQQQQIRTQLSFVLLGVLSQQLIPKAAGKGRALASEVLIVTSAVKSLIRESKAHQIYSVMQTSQKDGMKTMNQALYELYQKKAVTYEEIFERTTDPDDLKRIFKR